MPRSASTAPARSLVPPRSTPMTPRSTTRPRYMPDQDNEPQYTLYRSRPKLPWRKDTDGLEGLREPAKEEPKPKRRLWPFRRRERRPGRRRLTPGRVLAYLALAVGAWLLVSLVIFLISAQVQSAKISDAADAQLTGGGYPLTSPNTILVLGSDARTK